MKIDFDAQKHCYAINGIPVPGCTSVTGLLPKDWMAPWAAKECVTYIEKGLKTLFKEVEGREDRVELVDVLKVVGDGKNAYRRKSTKAADSGTLAHDWIDKFIQFKLGNGEMPESKVSDVHAANSIKLFLDWESTEKPQWVSSEEVVGSKIHGCAGKYDWTARFPEHGLVLGDNKTSSRIFDEHYIQVNGGYRLMHDEMFDEKIANSMILWIPKTGDDFKAQIVPTKLESDRAMFLALLGLYKAIKAREKSYD